MSKKIRRSVNEVVTSKEDCEKLLDYIQDCDIPNIEELRKNQIKDNVNYNKCPYDLIGKRLDYIEILPIEPQKIVYEGKDKVYCEWCYTCLCHRCGTMEQIRRSSLTPKGIKIVENEVSCSKCRKIYAKRDKNIGKIVNNWEILKVHHRELKTDNKKVVFYYICQCICCGEIRIMKSTQIKHNYCKVRIEENKRFLEEKRKLIKKSRKPNNIRSLIGMTKNGITIKNFGFTDLIGKRCWIGECVCGNLFYCSEDTFMSNTKNIISCGCRNSKGESKISIFLQEHNINFQSQFKASGCKDKYLLPFDFKVYYNEFNYFLIEYQGQQHYYPIDFSSTLSITDIENNFLIITTHDAIKRAYCKDNNIELLEIPFWEYDNIEKILKQKLNIQ